MEIDDRTELFKKLENYYTGNDNAYCKIIIYYKKHWLNSNYINYSELSESDYLNRTNNLLEYYHHLLNESCEVFHPKLSYLIHKYKQFLVTIYVKIKESLVKNNDTKNEKFSIINDIKKFFYEYNKKYKQKIDFFKIIQSEEEESQIINKICNYLLNLFYNIDVDEKDESEDLNNVNENDHELYNNENNDNKIIINEDVENKDEYEDISDEIDSDNIIISDEFEPKIKINYKNKKKKL